MIWLSYTVASLIIVTVVAAAVVYAANSKALGESESQQIDLFASSRHEEGCEETRSRNWDRFEVGGSDRIVRVIYYDSGSIAPCGVTLEDGAVGIFTTDPRMYTLDLAPHCVKFKLPPGEQASVVFRDAKSGRTHAMTLGLFDEFGSRGAHGVCVALHSASDEKRRLWPSRDG